MKSSWVTKADGGWMLFEAGPVKAKRIALDVQALQTPSASRGIGRYVRNLVTQAAKSWGAHNLVLIVNGHKSMVSLELLRELRRLAPRAKIAIWHPLQVQATSAQQGQLLRELESLSWAHFLNALDLDAFLIMSPFEGFRDRSRVEIPASRRFTVAAIIFDFIPLQLRSEYLEHDIFYKAFYFERLSELRHIDLALTLSHSERKRVASVIGLKIPVHVIGAGVDDLLKGPEPITAQDKQDFLVVGGADSRKNLDLIVQAFALFWRDSRENHRLVIVGDVPDEIQKSLLSYLPMRLRLQNRVIFEGKVSDEVLSSHYRKSLALVVASQYEGFGLPIVEAMSAGLFVICLNSDTSREILGAEYLGFFELSVSKLSIKMLEVVNLKRRLPELMQGFPRKLERHSWEAVAEATRSFLQLEDKTQTRATRETTSFLEAEINKTAASLGAASEEALLPAIASFLAKNLSQTRRGRIFVDVSEIAHRDAATGIQRVVRNLLTQLNENSDLNYDIAPIQGSQLESGYFHSSYGSTKFQSENRHLENQVIEYVPGDIFLGLDLQHYITIRNKSTFESMQLHGVLVVFVLYDLLPIQFPDFWPKEQAVAQAHVEWLKTISGADAVVAISKSVSIEYTNWLTSRGLRLEPQTGWFHIGSDLDVGLQVEGASFPWPGTGTRYLMVGTLEPRKGHGQTLDAFEIAWQDNANVQLTIVGRRGWLCEDLVTRITSHEEFGHRLSWLEKVPDDDLSTIYRSADAVIASSFGEGFGLPIVEAGFYGKRALARDIPVFREVSPPDSLFFTNPGDLARLIIEFKPTDQLSQQTYKPLTWLQSSQALLKVLEDLDLFRVEKNTRG